MKQVDDDTQRKLLRKVFFFHPPLVGKFALGSSRSLRVTYVSSQCTSSFAKREFFSLRGAFRRSSKDKWPAISRRTSVLLHVVLLLLSTS